ncbi:MAG: Uncharacterized protein XD94_1245 [Mesotoga prima]|uniref:Uncharacterized protein n=1 Tax=Mesotoga prima TaxID=1184387 RepID=A0A117M237_9BACT|nr:MAG: Uncharacterized protein XD94_1245 [Mesotoga prima]
MTELGVFGVTIRCHPGLDPGSVPRTNNLDAQRRSEEPVFPKDGSMVWGFYYVNSYKKGRLKGSSSRPAGSY